MRDRILPRSKPERHFHLSHAILACFTVESTSEAFVDGQSNNFDPEHYKAIQTLNNKPVWDDTSVIKIHF